jgi:hypothetical protein
MRIPTLPTFRIITVDKGILIHPPINVLKIHVIYLREFGCIHQKNVFAFV